MPFDGRPGQDASAYEISCAFDFLIRLERFFSGGLRWHRGELSDGDGKYCLIGAIDQLRGPDIALRYLTRIARARRPSCAFGSPVLAALNDNCRDFEELRDCLREAQELAAADLGHAVGPFGAVVLQSGTPATADGAPESHDGASPAQGMPDVSRVAAGVPAAFRYATDPRIPLGLSLTRPGSVPM
jgi:hypothetical protein